MTAVQRTTLTAMEDQQFQHNPMQGLVVYWLELELTPLDGLEGILQEEDDVLVDASFEPFQTVQIGQQFIKQPSLLLVEFVFIGLAFQVLVVVAFTDASKYLEVFRLEEEVPDKFALLEVDPLVTLRSDSSVDRIESLVVIVFGLGNAAVLVAIEVLEGFEVGRTFLVLVGFESTSVL